MPISHGTMTLPCCGRIDLLQGACRAGRPEKVPGRRAARWRIGGRVELEQFLRAAEAMNKAGHPFGLPLSSWSDASNFATTVFAESRRLSRQRKRRHDSRFAMPQGRSLSWFKRLVPHLPDGVFAWDNAQNNKFLISGQGSLIMNPPSAWAVAMRDRPEIGTQLWHFPPPKGPAGPLYRHQLRLSRRCGGSHAQ